MVNPDVVPAGLHPTEVYAYRLSSRSAAFFDLDRTLISGASAFVFAAAAWRKGLLPTRTIVRDSAKALAFRLAGASDEEAEAALRRALGVIAGVRRTDLLAISETTIPALLAKVRPEARDLIEWHRRSGRNTYIVSASSQELVEPLAVALGMSGGIGTVAEVVDGLYTGRILGPFCYGPGKAQAIRELAAWEGYDLATCYAYSDSSSDLPMMETVGHPVAVNPDAGLRRVAAQRAWPVVMFHRRTRRLVRRTTLTVTAGGIAGASFAAGWHLGRSRRGRP